jgi:DNA-directed RNA polymerase specialized sigma24 family protein
MASDHFGAEAEATDGEIIARSLSDYESFAGIFERHFVAIHQYLASRVGSELADDLAAQVFTIAFERRRASGQRREVLARGCTGSPPI